MIAMLLLLPSVSPAQEPFRMRVFQRPELVLRHRPYFDWLRTAPTCPCRFHTGFLPFSPSRPFESLDPFALDVWGSGSIFDPAQGRFGFQTPAGSEVLTDPWDPGRYLAWFLMSPEANPATCGFRGDLGWSDRNGDGLGEERGLLGPDACDDIGRGSMPAECAREWPHSALDQYDQLRWFEAEHRCKVILYTFSEMWCVPCARQPETAEALYQEYRDPDGDGVDEFVIVEIISEDEDRNGADWADVVRWSEGPLHPWATGTLTFPVIADTDAAIVRQYLPSFPGGCYPANLVIGADFVIDFRECGITEDLHRCWIEKNLCEILPADFVFPSGRACSAPIVCS